MCDGVVGIDTFGFDRVFNQMFYSSKEWHDIRNHVIVRDNGCDLGVPGYDIHGRVHIHHMNIVDMSDLKNRTKILLDPEYLITTTHRTHMAIHYGNENTLPKGIIERTPNDTCPWRQ
jgi:hypothetical protein